MRNLITLTVLMLAMHFMSPASARVLEVRVTSQDEVSLPAEYVCDTPSYEKITGTLLFGFDPENPANQKIVDLALAPRNARGLVEVEADFMVLRPKDARREGHTALVEVANRGRKASLAYFNRAATRALDPKDEADFGDALLMRQGLTLIWVGWQWDVPRQNELLRINVPVASKNGAPIRGLVRADWVVDQPTSRVPLAHRDHIAYPPIEPQSPLHRLTARDGRNERPRVVPREQWRFASIGEEPAIEMISGFEPGKIYELVYQSENPKVVGVGLAAIRDVISYAKYDTQALFPAQYGMAFGVSQTGRFLRHFLYQGFNADEQGRRAYDGMLIHSAGAGRGSFNHRFGQPSRDAHRYSAFFYPTDLFPFSGRVQSDPLLGDSGGILAAYQGTDLAPKIMYTNTAYEYWGRAASLLHTTPDGQKDVPPLDNERIYLLASGQHFVAPWPPNSANAIAGGRGYKGNPLDFLVNLRALLVALKGWVSEGTPPPPSQFPKIADGSLVPFDQYQPPLPAGMDSPVGPHVAYRANYGSEWNEGVASMQPPRLGPPFTTLVPAVDRFGNDRSGVRNLEIAVPLASYLPWSLRHGLANPREMDDFYGTLIPLRIEVPDSGTELADPRPAINSLYRDRRDFLLKSCAAADELVAAGYVLQEDSDGLIRRAGETWARFALPPPE